jgi:ATP-dependent helicase YprA (DUF1998 family)
VDGLEEEEEDADGSPSPEKVFVLWNPPLSLVQRPPHHSGVGAAVGAPPLASSSVSSFPPEATRQPRQQSDDQQLQPSRKSVLTTPGPLPAPQRRSTLLEAAFLFALCVHSGLRTFAFVKARKVCELVFMMATDILRSSRDARVRETLCARVASYRSGYTPLERRDLEAKLFSGALVGTRGAADLAVVVAQVVVRHDRFGLDARRHEEVDQHRLHLGLRL